MKSTKYLQLLLLLLFLVVAPRVVAQSYDMKVGGIKFIPLDPPIKDSYITQAAWGCDNIHVRLSEESVAGAIVEVTHYFENTAVITVFVQYVWYDLWDRMHVGSREYFFRIRCIAASSSLNYTSLVLDVGQSAQLQLSTPSYLFTPTWKSSNYGVVHVSYDGRVTAVGTGTATITCDPIVGPLLSCHVIVKNRDEGGGDEGGGNEGGGNEGGGNEGDDTEDEEKIEFEARLSKAKEQLHVLREESQEFIDNNRL